MENQVYDELGSCCDCLALGIQGLQGLGLRFTAYRLSGLRFRL